MVQGETVFTVNTDVGSETEATVLEAGDGYTGSHSAGEFKSETYLALRAVVIAFTGRATLEIAGEAVLLVF